MGGGTGHDGYYDSNTFAMAVGGGLAVKLIDVSALGATETVTVGAGPITGQTVSHKAAHLVSVVIVQQLEVMAAFARPRTVAQMVVSMEPIIME